MSSFQGVGIEGFHYIQRNVPFLAVGIEEFHCMINPFPIISKYLHIPKAGDRNQHLLPHY